MNQAVDSSITTTAAGVEGERGSFWRSFGFIIAGLVLLICGLVHSLPPGFSGFLLWIPGIALLSARSKRLSILLDRVEAWTRRVWLRYRSQH